MTQRKPVVIKDGKMEQLGNADTIPLASVQDAVGASDARLTNAREWNAGTISQAEAAAGTASTRRAWTALRVRQAITSALAALGGPAGTSRFFSVLSANNSTDFNTITSAGLHYQIVLGNSPNGPGPAAYYYVLVLSFGAGSLVQVAIPYRQMTISTEIYVRTYFFGGAWEPWFSLFPRNSIVGTASQVGGVPAGAIIERGSNSNGEYVRYADGTQICWHDITENSAIAVGFMGGFRGALGYWTFPRPFVDDSIVATGSTANAMSVQLPTPAFDAVAVHVFAVASQAAESRTAHCMAIGRWF